MAERAATGKFVKQTPQADPSAPPDNDLARVSLIQDAIETERPGLSVDAAIAHASMPDVGTPEYDKAVAELRHRRRIFGQSTQKLALPDRPGYHRHWFTDKPGRIEEARNNGWAHVLGPDRKPINRVVGSGRHGGAELGYAMELPLPLWEQDQAAIAKIAQARIDDIKGAGAFRAKPGQAKPSDEGKFYSAKEEPLRVSESLVQSRTS